MTNIAKTINSAIKGQFSSLVIYNDMFPKDDVEGIITVHDPATRVLNEYIDGTKELQLNISFTARYSNANTCRTNLTNILELLDGKTLSDSTDNLELKITTVANVQFIGTDDKKRSLYTCSISVDYKTTNF